jgi:tripartite-type tricarboxylate transporter receptor subunit TctC
MTTRRTWIRAAGRSIGGVAALAASGRISAQTDWPRKSIRLVVPFAPGGSSEIVARSVAAELTKQLGHSVFVENKPGGAGTVAMAEVAKADKDGHTLILGHVETLAVNPYMLPKQVVRRAGIKPD